MTVLIALVIVLLLYVAYLLRIIVRNSNAQNKHLQRSLELLISVVDHLAKVCRVLEFNFKQISDSFSETAVEDLVRSGKFLEAIKYRREHTCDSLEEGFSYIQRVAERIGVAMPGKSVDVPE
jgi:hypothetical protein